MATERSAAKSSLADLIHVCLLVAVCAVCASACSSSRQVDTIGEQVGNELEGHRQQLDQDHEVLAAALKLIYSDEAQGRAFVAGRDRASVGLLNTANLDGSSLKIESVSYLLEKDVRANFHSAAKALDELSSISLDWRDGDVGWVDPSNWQLLDLSKIDQSSMFAWDWFYSDYESYLAYVMISMPGVDAESGRAIVRFVIGPSAHGDDGLVLLSRHEGVWVADSIVMQHGF